MKSTHERIRDIREDNDLTQKKVAEILHISQRTYSDYELAKLRLSLDTLIKLAEFYDVSLDYLSGISDVKNKFPKK